MVPVFQKQMKLNGITTNEYSPCVQGFPLVICVTSPNQNEKEYHVESPVTIEHLGLPYKVIVQLQFDSNYVPVISYCNGVVDRTPVRRNRQVSVADPGSGRGGGPNIFPEISPMKRSEPILARVQSLP